MIDYNAMRSRRKRSRASDPEHTAEQDRKHKRHQRHVALADVGASLDECVEQWARRGKRGAPWTKRMRAALTRALAAVDRHIEVR